jgi:hypothetical protein
MGDGRKPGPISARPSWFDFTAPLGISGSAAGQSPLGFGFALPDRPAGEASLDFLFLQCRNPRVGLSEEDYADAAEELEAEVAAIRAVAQVETMGKAFDGMGRPTILFERHHFHRHTNGKYDATHSTISNAVAGGYGKFSLQYDKLKEAYELDADAALKSASWGRFQIMGSNFAACGFASARAFVLAMTRAESEHLHAFVQFVRSNKKRVKALQDKDWATFAKMYNGAGYKKRGYDVHMKDAYDAIVAADKPAAPGRPAVPGAPAGGR